MISKLVIIWAILVFWMPFRLFFNNLTVWKIQIVLPPPPPPHKNPPVNAHDWSVSLPLLGIPWINWNDYIIKTFKNVKNYKIQKELPMKICFSKFNCSSILNFTWRRLLANFLNSFCFFNSEVYSQLFNFKLYN